MVLSLSESEGLSQTRTLLYMMNLMHAINNGPLHTLSAGKKKEELATELPGRSAAILFFFLTSSR